jgi:hypothetical protein
MAELSVSTQIGIAILIVVIAYITFVPWLSLTHLKGIEEELSRIRKALEEKEDGK